MSHCYVMFYYCYPTFNIRFTFVLSQHDFNFLETQESGLGKKGNRQSNSLFYLPQGERRFSCIQGTDFKGATMLRRVPLLWNSPWSIVNCVKYRIYKSKKNYKQVSDRHLLNLESRNIITMFRKQHKDIPKITQLSLLSSCKTKKTRADLDLVLLQLLSRNF